LDMCCGCITSIYHRKHCAGRFLGTRGTSSTKIKLDGLDKHNQERLAKDGIDLGRSSSSSSQQRRIASLCLWPYVIQSEDHTHTHTHLHTLTHYFPGEPGIASCALDFPSPFVSVLCILLGQSISFHSFIRDQLVIIVVGKFV